MPNLELMLATELTEEKLIDLFLRLKKSEHTRRAYSHDIGTFQAFVKKPLNQVTLADALDYTEALNTLQITDKRGQKKTLEDNSKRRMINAVKSLYSFAFESGFFKVNIMKAVKPPAHKSAVSRHILPESTVLKMIYLEEEHPRNHAILYTLYASGLRVSELCDLRWRNIIRRADGCQLDIQSGKGDKQRHVFLPESAWKVLQALHTPTTMLDDFVFQSRQRYNRDHELKGQRMDTAVVFRIVQRAAKRAGVENWNEVSPHWLRHCHGSHSIDRGAPLSVVRDTMGHTNISTTNVYIQARPGQSSAHFLVLNK